MNNPCAPSDWLPDREAGPLRRCIVTGESKPKPGLLRFVVGPDRDIVPDLAEILPGRGIWLTPNRTSLQRAVDKRLFARAARSNVAVPTDLVDRVDRLLVRRCLDRLGIAKRAGALECGFEKVRGALREGRVAVLIEASDAAPQSGAKLAAPAAGLPNCRYFSRADLSLALGRENVVHAALIHGRLAQPFLTEIARLSEFRGDFDGDGASRAEPAQVAE
ncbi:RNA-binding protein [Oceanibacterium hippocampi]|uniref:YlxR domain-containing protein n=1 Tax=Oceanibacterium hippocampi TaxID=745714 RepID=A0A1Y5RJP3_9PROT|nr:RNA-binding protein [Oceanibacterium hippocampi]SLN19163.1 hypothetical protein OCH7691_00427 [Oceanibacterium hippocampi]